MQRNARKNMSYSFDIKLKAVKMYLEEGIGSTTIAKELNLSSNKRVLLWVKRFNEFGEDGLRERRGTTWRRKSKVKSRSWIFKKVINSRKGVISKSNIFRTIHQLKNKYNISILCKIGKVSRSGYYKWLNSNIINDKDLDLKYKILKIYNDSKKVYGYRRIKIGLFRAYGLIVNHKKIIRLMKFLNIHSIIRKKDLNTMHLKLLI